MRDGGRDGGTEGRRGTERRVQPVGDEGVRKLEHGIGIDGLGRRDEDELVDLDGGGEGGDSPALFGLPEIGDA